MAYVYAFITAAGTLLGGWLPFTPLFRSFDNRYLIGFAAGTMLGIAFFDLIPASAGAPTFMVAIGFFAVYLLEKFVLIHGSDEDEIAHHHVGWVPLIGVALESIMDGIAIAVGVAINPTLGLTIALAILAHELPRGFTTSIIMRRAGYNRRGVSCALGIDAFFTPLGVALASMFPQHLFPHLLAFTAGVFLYVGAGDLLPEAHKRFNGRVVVSVLAGAALIALVTFFVA